VGVACDKEREVMTVGFYGSVFFRSWLVVAQNVGGPRGKSRSSA
jgi:hypothetical protein